jgi:hypothetical protein
MIPNEQDRPSTALFTSITEQAGHQKTKTAAQHIKDACDYLEKNNIEISISQVGNFCKNSGPKTQSIHNNKEFCAYIKARHAEHKLVVKPSAGAVKYETDDPQANAIIYALQSEVKRVEQQLQNFKRALVDAGDYDLDATMRTARLVRLVDVQSAAVSAEIIDSLRRLFDPNHLIHFGLKILQDRLVAVDRNNRVLLEKADLQRLLAATQEGKTALPPMDAPKLLTDGGTA